MIIELPVASFGSGLCCRDGPGTPEHNRTGRLATDTENLAVDHYLDVSYFENAKRCTVWLARCQRHDH
ncbi:hypothetical protein BRPE64_ECDS00410 (plasmid) [Caballeronia insecticola]|uniref:Uncharacterized protein n=1 Tax=Caballeronia insecticola TaxID=758793 RepID=R4WUG8_9BURK|nr:hypothetical protein BRPE64_ECDS00410 [Caballeronia insecticola]